MASEKVLENYAKLAVCVGANVQKGQLLVINASVQDYAFVRKCVKAAYEAGAGNVTVQWSDEQIGRMKYEYCDLPTLCEVPQWIYDRKAWAQEKGCCFLYIESDTPDIMKGIDPEKIQQAHLATVRKMQPLRKYTMNNEGQWSIVALPSVGWAKSVFPDKSEDEGVAALMEAILQSVRVREDNDPVQAWNEHNETLHRHCKILNDYAFKALHFTNELGTDLTVELVPKHIWAGGSEFSAKGVCFNPNMPTEECFTMPYKLGTHGRVYASMPLSYQGKLIENFWLEFENGGVVAYGAEKEEDALKQLVEFDEGSRYLGEVALIGYDSPIRQTGILFLNTLFDENASCHLALGDAYPMNLQGGTDMDETQLAQAGANHSMTHVDFMFGSREMHIEGILADGSTVTVFDHGNFVL